MNKLEALTSIAQTVLRVRRGGRWYQNLSVGEVANVVAECSSTLKIDADASEQNAVIIEICRRAGHNVDFAAFMAR